MEEWKLLTIEDGGDVFVSSEGRVARAKFLSFYETNGYKRVDVCNNRETKKLRVHRLVAEAFIPNPDNLPYVNHKDKNRANNKAENLEWCDTQYNIDYSVSKKVAQIDPCTGEIIAVYKSGSEAG